jgi:Tfp pilus assembly protein PilO
MAGKGLLDRLRSLFPDMKELNTYRIELLGLAILVAFAFFFKSSVYSNQKEQLRNLKLEVSTKESEIIKFEAKSKAIAGLKRNVKKSSEKLQRVESRLASLKERLPSTSQISNLLVELSAEGSPEEVHVVSIKPMALEEKGELIRLPFQVNVESAFFSFGDYIQRLENLERVMVIENFKIEANKLGVVEEGKKRHPLASQVYLSAYILGPGK